MTRTVSAICIHSARHKRRVLILRAAAVPLHCCSDGGRRQSEIIERKTPEFLDVIPCLGQISRGKWRGCNDSG